VILPKSDVETVQGDCEDKVRDVSDLVVAFQISVTRVPKLVRVLDEYVQIVDGSEASDEARDELALATTAFVLAVPADMAEAIELEAVERLPVIVAVLAVISDCTASEPELSPAPVRLREPNVHISRAEIFEAVASCFPIVPVFVSVDEATFQTSDARVPNDVSVLADVAHTDVGSVANNEDEAVRTVTLVLLLIVVIAEESWEFVLAFTSVVTLAIPAANEVEAARIEAFVFAFTSVVTLAVPSASEVEALRIVDAVEAVPAVIADAIEEEAVVTSDVFASVPTVSVASVRLRVA
jgi:hypothetical protein